MTQIPSNFSSRPSRMCVPLAFVGRHTSDANDHNPHLLSPFFQVSMKATVGMIAELLVHKCAWGPTTRGER